MMCNKCNGENFILESTIAVTEKYKIFKNGNISYHPFQTDYDEETMADNDNVIRCSNCQAGYILPETKRKELLKTNFKQVNLNKCIKED